MRKINILIIIGFVFSASLFAVVPEWAVDLDKVFPSENFIKAVCDGCSVEEAKKKALVEISQYFNQQISTYVTAESEVSNKNASYSENSVLKQRVEILSEIELSFIQFTSAYYDKRNKKYFICGYIDKNIAWNYIIQKLSDIEILFLNCVSKFECERELLIKFLELYKAEYQMNEYVKTYKIALCIFSERCSEYADFIKQAREKIFLLSKIKNEISVQVNVKNDKNNKIRQAVIEKVSKYGISTVNYNGLYLIDIEINWNDLINNEIYSSEPNVFIYIKNGNKQMFSCSKKCEKFASRKVEITEVKAIENIKKIIINNLFQEYCKFE